MTPGAMVNAELFVAGVKGLDLKPFVDALNEKGRAIGIPGIVNGV